MKIQFITQPDVQLGEVIINLLNTNPLPINSTLVSAFVKFQTITRLKEPIVNLLQNGNHVKLIFGINLGGTSKEVLQEVIRWNAETIIYRHLNQRHTFHPKLFVFEWDDKAEIIIGSHNITEGGFFNNYEASVKISYELPNDEVSYFDAKKQLRRFLNPPKNISYALTDDFLNQLISRNEIPTEAEARANNFRNRIARSTEPTRKNADPIFGSEPIPIPPPPPTEFLKAITQDISRRRRQRKHADAVNNGSKKVVPPLVTSTEESINPQSFFMTLPTLQGPSIPGEARIPLVALELAQDFWGWPKEYDRIENPRGGQQRVYWNWYPNWKIWSVSNPEDISIQEVRLYFYENSSDFRFYARPLVNTGADLGDVVQIRRLDQQEVDFECILARKDTPEFNLWIKFCTQPVQNSSRRFGYI